MSIEAMKQALDVLEGEYGMGGTHSYNPQDVMELLEKAIEEAEKQEPIGWLNSDGSEILFEPNIPVVDYYPSWVPLYTAPPAQEWVGLTNEEIKEFLMSSLYPDELNVTQFARAIEAKLKEKNT